MYFLRFINDRERVSNSSQSVFLNTYDIKKKDRKKNHFLVLTLQTVLHTFCNVQHWYLEYYGYVKVIKKS